MLPIDKKCILPVKEILDGGHERFSFSFSLFPPQSFLFLSPGTSSFSLFLRLSSFSSYNRCSQLTRIVFCSSYYREDRGWPANTCYEGSLLWLYYSEWPANTCYGGSLLWLYYREWPANTCYGGSLLWLYYREWPDDSHNLQLTLNVARMILWTFSLLVALSTSHNTTATGNLGRERERENKR